MNHADDAERAGLDHGDRVQQRADRGRRHHRLRQPAVQRHQGRLGAQAGDQEDEDGDQRGAVILHQAGQEALRRELEIAGQRMQPGDAGQKKRAAG